jgi:hypothetical protein
MDKIKIRDYAFAHAKYSTDFQDSKFIEWDRGPITAEDKVVFYTDSALELVHRESASNAHCKKIAWLLEPVDVHPHSYEFIRLTRYFDLVLSHNLDFVMEMQNRGVEAQWVPFGGCWIKPEDQRIYDKNGMTSIIASNKQMTIGHRLRHSVIATAGDKMTVRGRGYTAIDYKLDLLKDFRFHVVIENTNIAGWFTEKLIDCFRTGTVPIYWGNPLIGEIFDREGMIICHTEQQIIDALNSVTLEKYDTMKEAIQRNFEIAQTYLIAEDYIYKNILSK